MEPPELEIVPNRKIFLHQAANAGIKTSEYRAYASGQIGYMLGENPSKFSYVVGYGENFPKQPHHKVKVLKNIKIINDCRPHPVSLPLQPATGEHLETQANRTHIN